LVAGRGRIRLSRTSAAAAQCDRNGGRRLEKKFAPLHGASYVKTTPVTVPRVAVPTARIPLDERLIPAGRRAPLGSTPKVPPRVTPVGRVELMSKVAPLLTVSAGTFGVQAAGAAGAGAGAGGGVGAGEFPTGDEASPPPHPASAPPAKASPPSSNRRRFEFTSTCFSSRLSLPSPEPTERSVLRDSGPDTRATNAQAAALFGPNSSRRGNGLPDRNLWSQGGPNN
jgi:hypothetical protein